MSQVDAASLTWIIPLNSAPYTLVALSADALVAARLTPEQIAAAEPALAAGTPPQRALGPAAVVVPLKSVLSAKAEVLPNVLTVRYGRTEATAETLTVPFHKNDDANAVFLAMRAMLGDGYFLEAHNHSKAKAATWPLVALLAVEGLFVILAAWADGTKEWMKKLTDLQRSKANPLARLAYALDWEGVMAVGAVAGVAVIVWLVVKLRRLPIVFTLTRRG